MLLGDVLARFNDDSVAAETILRLDGLALVARLTKEAEAQGCSLGEFAASSVRQYAANAPDEEWITLMGALGRASDPGAECMKRAFAFVLSEPVIIDDNPVVGRPVEEKSGGCGSGQRAIPVGHQSLCEWRRGTFGSGGSGGSFQSWA